MQLPPTPHHLLPILRRPPKLIVSSLPDSMHHLPRSFLAAKAASSHDRVQKDRHRVVEKLRTRRIVVARERYQVLIPSVRIVQRLQPRTKSLVYSCSLRPTAWS